MARERLKVLIVDDDPFIAEMYRLRLEAEGYDVSIAADGEEGLALAMASVPSIICLDYRLPGIDGLEALERLRAEPSTKSIPVIMFSNDGDPALARARSPSWRAPVRNQSRDESCPTGAGNRPRDWQLAAGRSLS